ncbi:MAG: sensor histidine kinase [Richelia sp. RM2_1_2]|nr:sensor histidine kinase [Richelia sp. SM1_7_0]NJN09537.1 sensor histidine kinase [Richelia sp. RM1_1_1]NJO59214.1 sensor histidine kinase [Richelia sp. RM2_1_2]
MKIAVKIKNNIKLEQHPLRLLLYLEWALFGISIIIMNLPPARNWGKSLNINPTLLILSIIIFGIIGLRLPNGDRILKIIYIFIELLLILLINIGADNGIGFSPVLLLIVVIRSVSIFKLRGSLLVAGLVWICFIFTLNRFSLPPTKPPVEMLQGENLKNLVLLVKLNFVMLFSLVLIFVFLLVNALFEIALAHKRLREYALRIEDQATLQERNRIAREIHDALGHSLTAQSIQLENALVYLESNLEKAKVFLLEARQISANLLQEVRHSVTTLRYYDPLQGKSLDAAIKLLIRDFQSRTQIIPDYSQHGILSVPHELSINITIYRIIQEALTNISKHSQATEVKITIQATKDAYCLRIEDNGIGFDPNQNTRGFGLQGMQERTSALGGQLSIKSVPQGGCQLMALFPLSGLEL